MIKTYPTIPRVDIVLDEDGKGKPVSWQAARNVVAFLKSIPLKHYTLWMWQELYDLKNINTKEFGELQPKTILNFNNKALLFLLRELLVTCQHSFIHRKRRLLINQLCKNGFGLAQPRKRK